MFFILILHFNGIFRRYGTFGIRKELKEHLINGDVPYVEHLHSL